MKRFVLLMALLASFTLVTGTALAVTHPDNRPTHGPGAVALEQQSGVVRPDDRSAHGPGAIEVGLVTAAIRPDDRATHGQGAVVIAQMPGSGQLPAVAPTEAVRTDGFDWVDAAIGAAAALGIGLIVAGGLTLVLRRTHTPAYS